MRLEIGSEEEEIRLLGKLRREKRKIV